MHTWYSLTIGKRRKKPWEIFQKSTGVNLQWVMILIELLETHGLRLSITKWWSLQKQTLIKWILILIYSMLNDSIRFKKKGSKTSLRWKKTTISKMGSTHMIHLMKIYLSFLSLRNKKNINEERNILSQVWKFLSLKVD